MPIDVERANKPLRKLRKWLRDWPTDPSPEEVHSLRTNTRRAEALANALMLEDDDDTRKLLKKLKPIRKAAGDARDSDVLVSQVMTLRQKEDEEDLVRLLEHLGAMRTEQAKKLHDLVTGQRKAVRRGLKQLARTVEDQLAAKQSHEVPATARATAMAIDRTEKLARWPRLTVRNIHPFRIEVKELQYTLQLAENADGKAVGALKAVKDEIGAWHDWQQLLLIAREVLDERQSKELLRRISEIISRKLAAALHTANAVRKALSTMAGAQGRLAG